MVTFESADDTTVVVVDNLVGVMDSLGVFAGFGSMVLSADVVWINGMGINSLKQQLCSLLERLD